MLENAFYMMDIYNDSAHRALFVLNQQYLYDEIEAEAILVLDQFVYLISDEIFSYYKNLAASIKLDKTYKEKLEISGANLSVDRKRYDIIMLQRNVELLGRSVDLNFLICQHVNGKLVQGTCMKL